MHSLISFFAANRRWLAGGLLLTIFSSFGQTFFISLFSGEIRYELGLSHGEFGAVYMAGTLASALTLVWIGRVVDRFSVANVAVGVCLALGLCCVAMANVNSVAMLLAVIFGLRLTGQGMMTHTAITAMGKWYSAERGRAVSLTAIGHQVGEGVLPFLVTLLLLVANWRFTWLLAAALMCLAVLPAVYFLLRVERVPRKPGASAESAERNLQPVWTRKRLLRDSNFLMLCIGSMGPSFIGTSFFFHLVYISEENAWPRQWVAVSFLVLSVTTTVCALLAGVWVDRLSARRILPFYLLPLGLGCVVLSIGGGVPVLFLFMLLLGVAYGLSSTLFGSIWAEVYGTENLGTVRALAVAAMVLSSALGPGITGWYLDQGVSWSTQLQFMAMFCFSGAVVMSLVSRRLLRLETPKAGV